MLTMLVACNSPQEQSSTSSAKEATSVHSAATGRLTPQGFSVPRQNTNDPKPLKMTMVEVKPNTYPAEVAQRILSANHSRYRKCFEDVNRARAELRFNVGKDEKTTNVNVTSEPPDAKLTKCLTEAIRHQTFANPDALALEMHAAMSVGD